MPETQSRPDIPPRLSLVLAVIPIVALAATVGGLAAGVYEFQKTYKASAENAEAGRTRDERARTDALSRDVAVRQQELRRRYWEAQYETYREASRITGTIASSRSVSKASREIAGFWMLYWGPMSLVEDRAVQAGMIEFGKQVSAWQRIPRVKPTNLEGLSYELAHCMRESLAATWKPSTEAPLNPESCRWAPQTTNGP